LQQKHNQDEKSVYHDKGKHGRITQLFQIFCNTCLKREKKAH
jgi:hypothetical protein